MSDAQPVSTSVDRRQASVAPSPLLIAVAAIGTMASLYAALIYAPTEATEGEVQRLMYLHLPVALTMYLAITVLFVTSLLYLQSRDSRWDEVAAVAGELGLFFGSLVMITGPIWAKPIWGTWWTWDARLTSFFVLFLIFIGYVMLRAYGGAPEQVARFCAVLAVLGFIGMPITHYSVVWWRTLHPAPKLLTEGGLGAGLPQSMLITIAICLLGTLLLFINLFAIRLRLERQSRRVLDMRRRLDLVENLQ